MPSPSRADLIAVAKKLIASRSDLSPASTVSTLSPSCRTYIGPSSIDQTGGKGMSNAELTAMFEPMASIFQNNRIIPPESDDIFIVDVEARKISFHVRSEATSRIGQYRNEYIFFLTIAEEKGADGEWKVKEIREFTDSAYTKDYMERLQLI